MELLEERYKFLRRATGAFPKRRMERVWATSVPLTYHFSVSLAVGVVPVILHSRRARPDLATQAWLERDKPPLRLSPKAMSQDPLFTPSFDNVLGGMHGYDAENPGVTKENLKVLIDWIFDEETLAHEGADENWLRLWATINRKQMFWLKYFMGIEVEVTAKVISKLTPENFQEFRKYSGS